MGVCIVIGYNLHGKAGMQALKRRNLILIKRIRCKAEADGQHLRWRALGKPASKGEQQRQGQQQRAETLHTHGKASFCSPGL